MTILAPSQDMARPADDQGAELGEASAEPSGSARRPAEPARSLGSKAIKEQHGRVVVSPADMRRRLWDLQRTMWAVTRVKRLRGCHRWLARGTGAASLRWADQGQVSWGNIQTSGSVWSSPLSAGSISKTRAVEMETALRTWFDQDSRHSVEFLTLTVRHDRQQSLKEVWDQVAYCWRGVTNTQAWRGGRRMVGDLERYGIAHWAKSVEVTHGAHGWHVHVHVLLFLDQELSDDERESLENRVFNRWARAAQRRGCEAPTREHGVRLEKAVKGKSAHELGSYMAKGALASVAESLAWEMTGGQTAKQARGNGNRSPFQILQSIRQAGDFSTDNPDVRLWHEWEAQSSGRRQIAWSKGSKSALGVADVTDEEAEQEAEALPEAHVVALVGYEEWKRTRDDGSKLCDDLHTRHFVAEYVSQAKTLEKARRLAEDILRSLGVESQSVPTVT